MLTLIDGAEDAKGTRPRRKDRSGEDAEPCRRSGAFKKVVDGYAVATHWRSRARLQRGEDQESAENLERIHRTHAQGEWQAPCPINVASTAPTAVIWNFNDVLGGKGSDITPVIAKVKSAARQWQRCVLERREPVLTQMQSGEADIGIYWDGRAWAARDGGFKTLNFYYLPLAASSVRPSRRRSRTQPDLAWEFMNFVLSNRNHVGRRHSISGRQHQGDLQPRAEGGMPEWQSVRWPPFAEILVNMPRWVETWNKEIGR